jgi:hypothetical protein
MATPFIWQYWDEDDNDNNGGSGGSGHVNYVLEDQFWILVRLIIFFLPVIVTYKMIILCEKFLHNTPIMPIMSQ